MSRRESRGDGGVRGKGRQDKVGDQEEEIDRLEDEEGEVVA